MAIVATAIYEHGNLRLLEPLDLPERAQVQVEITPQNGTHLINGSTQSVNQRTIDYLIKIGRIRANPVVALNGYIPLSTDESLALAKRLGNHTSWSAMIIEDRDDRV